MTRTALLIVAVALIVSGCDKKSATEPTPTPTPAPAPAATRIIALAGAMDFGKIQVGQSFQATLNIRNNGNAPLTITGITGNNGITSVLKASWTSGTIPPNSSVDSAIAFMPTAAITYGGTLQINGDQTSGTNTIAFTGTGSLDGLPIYRATGSGNQVIDGMPSYVTRVRVTGSFSGSCQNFVIYVNNRLIVNEILGTCSVASGPTYDGTHQLPSGAGSIRSEISTGVLWTVTEVR